MESETEVPGGTLFLFQSHFLHQKSHKTRTRINLDLWSGNQETDHLSYGSGRLAVGTTINGTVVTCLKIRSLHPRGGTVENRKPVREGTARVRRKQFRALILGPPGDTPRMADLFTPWCQIYIRRGLPIQNGASRSFQLVNLMR
jgi:hypothetical protein